VSMIIRVYVPASQRSFRFDVPDNQAHLNSVSLRVNHSLSLSLSQVRTFLQQSMGGNVVLSNNEIMDKRCLALLCDRLMCRVIEGQPIIYISRRTIGERGIQVARKGVNICGHRVIVTVFWSNDEVSRLLVPCAPGLSRVRAGGWPSRLSSSPTTRAIR
jgi:hypothetical protein